jgi:hypothetical protein
MTGMRRLLSKCSVKPWEAGTRAILRLAFERVDWSRDDPRWFGVLEQAPRCASGVECFRVVLARTKPSERATEVARDQNCS